MLFECVENKNQINISKRGINFNQVRLIFNEPMVVKKDIRNDYIEDRYIGIGSLLGNIIIAVWTIRNDRIRIISARKANKNERKIYYEKIKK